MKKLIYSIMVVFLLTLGIIGTSSMEVDAAVIVSKLDFDLNGTIDIDDLAKVASNYQLTGASNNWSSKYDLNNDNIIDIYDVVLISKAIGTSTIVNDNTDITSKFIDEKFKSQVYEIIKKSNSAPILYSDVKGITEVKTDPLGISNLSGIEYFTSLTDLDCKNNQLTNLDLTSNTELMTLDCTNNAIRTLNLSNNTELAFLFCSNNKLQSLNVNSNVLLEYLNCEYNELKGLDVSKNKALWWLICNFNGITTLDLSPNTGLMILECSNNQLTTLDLSKNSELGKFNCTGNQITTLYATKGTWSDESSYKEQYTDASHKVTTNSLTIKVPLPNPAEVVNEARKHLGKPYLYGAVGPDSFDCSGFTSYVYKAVAGIDIGRTTYDQIKAGISVVQADLQLGDLVFTSSSHVGIYVGNGRIIHCPKTGDVVKESDIWTFYAGRRIIR